MILRRKKPDLARVLIEEGSFVMGAEGHFGEAPAHEVFVSPFEIAKRPVTNREFALYLKATRADPPPFWDRPGFSSAEQPVVGVNWHEASAFCLWLSSETGLEFRLPTEAEFEKAARGGARGRCYPWGDDLERSRYCLLRGPLASPYEVGANPPNDFGLYDMVSNVYQWCLDGFEADYYAHSPPRNPRGADRFDTRTARAMSWKSELLVARCAQRHHLAPYFRCDDFGFRWVRAFSSAHDLGTSR